MHDAWSLYPVWEPEAAPEKPRSRRAFDDFLDGYGMRAPRAAPRDTDQARRVDMVTVFDDLGPLTRAALRDAPADVHVGKLLNEAPSPLTKASPMML